MMRMMFNARKVVLAGIMAGLLVLGIACSSSTDEPKDCVADPDCSACVQDGQCCEFSINCQPGSICNDASEDLYDPTKEDNICIRVVCTNDQDCEAPKKCSLEKICKPEICQNNDQCGASMVCLNGSCEQAPSAQDAASCEIVTRDLSIRQGATVELTAVARNQNGAVLPLIGFDWTSDDTNVVSISDNIATGGGTEGTALISATVTGKTSVSCTNNLNINNFPNVVAGSARVVLADADSGAPIPNALVVFMAGGTWTATTGTNGAATIQTASAIESVTAVKEGWQYISIIQPGTNDIFIPIPGKGDDTVAGGFRGVVDLSTTKRGDVQLGIAGPALPSNILDFALDSLIGDSVNTVIDAPELGLDQEELDLPGGVMLGLGNKKFTVDSKREGGQLTPGLRCQGAEPTDDQLGCFLARAPKGPSGGWVLAGQLKLSQVTSIANELSSAFGGSTEDINIGEILTAILPLLRNLNHGLIASLIVEEFPKVNKDGQSGDCSDPNLADYSDKCQADFQRYQRSDIPASAELGVLSDVTVPNLPDLPAGGCAAAAVLLSGASLEGRGLVPLGLTAGVDTVNDTDTPDCKVAGIEKPFGENSPDLQDGHMALSMAPPHSGIEGSDLFLLLFALDLDSLTDDGGLQLSAVIQRVDSVGEQQNLTGNFLPYPQGTVNGANRQVTFNSAITGATLVRAEVQRGDDTWLIYAPGTTTTLDLPNVSGAPATILSDVRSAYVLAMGSNTANYSDIWTFGSGKTFDRLIDLVDSFVIQQCYTDAGSICQIE